MGQVIQVDFAKKRVPRFRQLGMLLEIQNLREKISRLYATIPTKNTVRERENVVLCISNAYKEIGRLEQLLRK